MTIALYTLADASAEGTARVTLVVGNITRLMSTRKADPTDSPAVSAANGYRLSTVGNARRAAYLTPGAARLGTERAGQLGSRP